MYFSPQWRVNVQTLPAGYHGVFDHSVAPSFIVIRDVGLVAVRTVKAALHVVTIVTEHPQHNLAHTNIKHHN